MLIFIDGIDGTGKSTLVANLFDQILEEPVEKVPVAFQFPSRIPEHKEKATPLHRAMFHLQDFHDTMREHRRTNDIRIFDRSFVSTMAYQGFNDDRGEELLHPRYEALFRLGAEILLGATDPKTIGRRRKVVFLRVRCDPEVAAMRIRNRNTERVDDIESLEEYDALIDRLATLDDRFGLCYSHIRMNINRMFPVHDYAFYEVDSTDKGEDAVLDDALGAVKSLGWPNQQLLL